MKTCLPGVVTDVPSEGTGPSVAVWVGQAGDDPGGWELELYASGIHGPHFVRRHVLAAPSAQLHAARIVMVETVPGAVEWRCRVLGPAPVPGVTRRGLAVAVRAEKCASSSSSLTTVPVDWPNWIGAAYNYRAGANGALAVPGPGWLTSVAAWKTAAGGTVAIDGGDAAPVPPAGSVRFDFPIFNLPGGVRGAKATPSNIVFTGTDGYLVEFLL